MTDNLTARDEFQNAQLYFSKGQFDKALKSLKISYAFNNEDFNTNFLIGKILYLKKQYEKAKKVFSELVEVNINDEDAKLYLAYCYYKTGKQSGDVDIAENMVNTIIKNNDKNIYAIELLADIYLYRNRYENALENYERIKAGSDNLHRIIFKETLCYYHLNDFVEAETLCSQLFKAGFGKSKEVIMIYEACKKQRKDEYIKSQGKMTLTKQIFTWIFDGYTSRELSIKANGDRRVNHIARKAYTDPLTGAKNRLYVEEHLKPVFSNDKVLTLLHIDIDKFKTVNDLYGHDKADIVLKHFGKIGKEIFYNEFYRSGGEEFLAVIEGNKEQAAFVAEKFRETVERELADLTNHDTGLAIPKITCSMGIAEYPLESKNFDQAYSLADKRLYHAKETGRNRICQDGEGMGKVDLKKLNVDNKETT
jgi:diguanylate cyclase (GGDEF)-like protein